MRKRTPDLYYREQTGALVKRIFQPWQLIVRDPREGFHRLLNRIVSLAQDLDEEARYVESMFFPDSCDLSEPYKAVTFHPPRKASEVLIDGVPLTERYPEAASIDEFLAGTPSVYRERSTVSVPVHQSLSMTHTSSIYLLAESGAVYSYSLIDNSLSTIREPSAATRVDREIIISSTSRTFLIYDENPTDITVEAENGTELPITILTDRGNYNPDFDPDGDGVIGEYERQLIQQAYGMRAEATPLDVWNKIGWCDIDEDGFISEADIAHVTSYLNSFDPTATAAVTVIGAYRGLATLSYKLSAGQPLRVFADVLGDRPEYDVPDELSSCLAVTYDRVTDLYYVVDTETQLRAVRTHPVLKSVVSDQLIHVPLTASGSIMDIDLCDGTLYALIKDGNDFFIASTNVRGEYVEELTDTAPVETSVSNLSMIGAGSDGVIVASNGSTLAILLPTLQRSIEVDGRVYLNECSGSVYTDTNGASLTAIPHYIFNNFDSFAYSLGILRPPGRDNFWMRDAIYDFFRHRQGNTAIGMTYGIMRETGVIPASYYSLPVVRRTPNRYNLDRMLTINGEIATVTSGETVWIITTSSIQMETPDGQVYVIYSGSGSLLVSGSVYDGNGDLISDVAILTLPSGIPYTDAPVRIAQFDGWPYLEEHALISGNVPTDALIDAVVNYEQTEPTIWANATTSVTPVAALRVSVDPVMSTTFGDEYISRLLAADSGEVIV